jgi:hypothetical protein
LLLQGTSTPLPFSTKQTMKNLSWVKRAKLERGHPPLQRIFQKIFRI